MRANLAAALNERDHGFFAGAAQIALVALSKVFVLFLAADVGFVKFHRLAFAAKRAGRVQIAHTFANTMTHKPRGFVGQPDHAVKLMGAHALLAGAHQMRRQKPLGHGDMRALVDRTDSRRELLPAVFAVIPARPHRLATKLRNAVKRTAERAIWTLRPADRFEVLPGGFKVGENRVRQINSRGHGLSPKVIYPTSAVFSQGDNSRREGAGQWTVGARLKRAFRLFVEGDVVRIVRPPRLSGDGRDRKAVNLTER